MIFDTHAHYDDEDFNEDREELLASMEENGVKHIVNIGASMESTRTSVALADKYDFMYAAVGVHPNDTESLTEQDMEELKEYCKNNKKVVAIGEIGLEYHYLEPSKEVQRKWFLRQLDLAAELQMPVVIHSRDAAEETFQILKQYEGKVKGVVHCYSYSKEMAREYVKMGYYIGVGGVVTFKNGKKLKETVEDIPLEKIVIETDCPYLSPEPNRGRRNSSLNLPYVVKQIAELKHVSEEEVMEVTYKNALDLYKITE